ncbi:PAS domain S-box protein [Aquincola sp. S2]|uniref:histidine kinase n=1 Tax=Pseudaquabacterium terrae TaxID=2732868 RepID=A0ABX2ENU3_9BURK|nr:ATP-binding protein [Aquabacterium terrae]NRF70321.1 PAS domain S-box protein [Aquabacterium terrae]
MRADTASSTSALRLGAACLGVGAALAAAAALWWLAPAFAGAPAAALQRGLIAGAVSLLLLGALAGVLWRAQRFAAHTLRQTAKELRRGQWETAVAGLREPRRAVPSAFGDLAEQVEGVISESERRWRARVEMSTDWYWEIDQRFKLSNLSADAPIAKPAGRALGDLLGRRHDELAFLQPPAMGWASFHDLLERQEKFRDVEIAISGLGARERGWIALSGRPRFRSDGLFGGYEGVARDITSNKEAFRRLQASEQRYAVMAGLSADWYWITDDQHRFPQPSADMLRRFGNLVLRNVGKTRWEAYPDALAVEQWALHRDELDMRQPFRALEFPVQRDDGRTIWLSLAGAPRFDDSGEFVGYHGVGRDITLRKVTEQMLQRHNRELQLAVTARTRELELANRDLDAFARQLAHELRTPIGHVQGLAELLRQRLGARLDAGEGELLDLQSRAAQEMLATLEALLELARSSSAAIERQAVDLSALALEVIAQLPVLERAAPVDWQIEPALVVWASPQQLRIVLQNLLGNAAKFTRRVPRPRIAFSGQRDAEGQLLLRIEDNGAGFEPELVGRLFQPFQRLHRNDDFHGNGIGLTIVQRIVQRHGGTISASGAPGVGAVFEFTLGQREAVRPDTAADKTRETAASPRAQPA